MLSGAAHGAPAASINPRVASAHRAGFAAPRSASTVGKSSPAAVQDVVPPGTRTKTAGAGHGGKRGELTTLEGKMKKVSADRGSKPKSTEEVAVDDDFAPPPPSSETVFQPSPNPTPTASNVLDELPERFDDGTYMDVMGVGAHSFAASNYTPSQEYAEEDDLDNEDEGFVAKGMAANYTVAEDKLLCDAYKKVGLDATVGVEQPKEAYWVRMWEYFVARNTSDIERNMGSIRHRWHVINADCQKWAACLANVDRLNPSGTNSTDRNSIAQNMFKQRVKKCQKGTTTKDKKGISFTLHHAFEELENDEK
ncbi:hypothetical protein D1007_49585 [Hordeum vulgare]|nr:hypothetical protein D1007_49585 [Hordeum vulgare]